MTKLEEEVDRLRELDRSRELAVELRDRSWDVLCDSELASHEESPPYGSPPQEESILAAAEVLKALLTRRVRAMSSGVLDPLISTLENVTHDDVLRSAPDKVPVLRSAKAMCALAAAPDSAFSSSVMYFLYTIVREIYVATPPDWSVGGARAGEGAAPSGFVTWQCVRAIADFQQAMTQTARLLKEVATLLKQSDRYRDAYHRGEWDGSNHPELPPHAGALEQWDWVDAIRLDLSFITTVDTLRDNIALELTALTDLFRERRTGHVGQVGQVGPFIADLRVSLRKEISSCRAHFWRAGKILARHRVSVERAALTPAQFRLSNTAHRVALKTVRQAWWHARQAGARFKAGHPPAEELESVAGCFDAAAREFEKLLQPVTAHVTRVLDSEMGIAAGGSPYAWDPAELAFATAAYTEATGRRADERVRRAMDCLLGVIGERGEFPVGRPIRTSTREYRLHATNADVIRALARILEGAHDVELAPAVVKRMVAFFDSVRSVAAPAAPKSPERLTVMRRRRIATDVLALTAIQRMLDARINHLVFRHFSVKRPEDLSISSLSGLFYPDYGLTVASASARTAATSEGVEAVPPVARTDADASIESYGIYRKRSVAEVLERMRAHVNGLAPSDDRDPVFSLVLHGPPGTGKTTLVESLAKTCEVPMLEVTPSDIVIAGVDAIESQARAVFYALSLLTRVVILLDEFDPVLLRRSAHESTPTQFSFLTPGMLPKLKTLHESAKERSVAYVLVTNLIGKLDEAAIRAGRFDEHLGIYPPDLLSRFGRLRHEVEAYNRWLEAEKKKAPQERLAGVNGAVAGSEPVADAERIWTVVRDTAGGPMNTLGKPGWFTAPSKPLKAEKKNAFTFIYRLDSEPEVPAPEAYLELLAISPEVEKKARKRRSREATSGGSPPTADSGASERREPESHAEREFKEWAWTDLWDRNARRYGDASAGSPPVSDDLPSVPVAWEVNAKWDEALMDWLHSKP